jgi:hypothetical protein
MRRQKFYQRNPRNSIVSFAVHTVHTRKQLLPIQAFPALGLRTRRRGTFRSGGRQRMAPVMDGDLHTVLKSIQGNVNSVIPTGSLRNCFAADIPSSLSKLSSRPALQPRMRRLMFHSGTKHTYQARVLIEVENTAYRLIGHWIGPRLLRRLHGNPGNSICRPCTVEPRAAPCNSSNTYRTGICLPADRIANKEWCFASYSLIHAERGKKLAQTP